LNVPNHYPLTVAPPLLHLVQIVLTLSGAGVWVTPGTQGDDPGLLNGTPLEFDDSSPDLNALGLSDPIADNGFRRGKSEIRNPKQIQKFEMGKIQNCWAVREAAPLE